MLWNVTVPSGRSLSTAVALPTLRPLASISSFAFSTVMPTSDGTRTSSAAVPRLT